MSKKVTLATIAHTCGISVGTVSRALSEKPDINPETKARVLETAAQLGYQKFNGMADRKELRICIVYCQKSEEFYERVTAGILDAERELQKNHPVRVTLLRTEYLEQKEQSELLQSLCPDDFDALLINSASNGNGVLIDQLIAQGLPVATFNTDAPTSERLFFVGTNAYQSGCLSASLMGKLMGEKGKVLILGNFAGSSCWMDRFSGFCSVIQNDFPNILLMPSIQCYKSDHIVAQEIKTLLAENPDITGIFPTNATCTCGTIEALRELDRKDLSVVGYDLSSGTRAALIDGYCDAVLHQNPYRQGYLAVKCMTKYLLNHQLPDRNEISLPTNIILKYNMATC